MLLGLAEIETANNPIMSILKLSYDNLEPAVKDCFSYCALFPDNRELLREIYAPDIAKHEAVLTKLKPHRNLKQLFLFSYCGSEIPKWGRVQDDWGTILPNLVKIELQECPRLHGLPLLSTLKHLKSLNLHELHNLEYVENNGICSSTSPFLPSLEDLTIDNCTRLKGWWRGIRGGDSSSSSNSLPAFPRLCALTIRGCSELISLPPCPSLESLEVTRAHKSLRKMTGEDTGNSDIKLEVKNIDSVSYLTTLPASRLTSITIKDDHNVKSLAEIEDVFVRSRFSLRSLTITGCRNLTCLSGGLEHPTALESLYLSNIPRVDDEDGSGMPWKSLHRNLLSLTLKSIDNMEALPQGIKYLTSLQNLSISQCNKLTCLPEWISCLSSLDFLEIENCHSIKSLPAAIQNVPSLTALHILLCSDLCESCLPESSQDWPKIQHIPDVAIFHEPD